MPKVARLGDTSTHGGAVASAASHTKFEGQLCARQGDAFSCPLHGPQTIVGGSGKYNCEGKPIAREGDAISCGATLISSAAKYNIG